MKASMKLALRCVLWSLAQVKRSRRGATAEKYSCATECANYLEGSSAMHLEWKSIDGDLLRVCQFVSWH